MKIRNIFKKFEEDKSSSRPSPSKEGSEKKEEVKAEKPLEVPIKRAKERKFFATYKVLKTPHVTEKATDLVGKNQYTFKIGPQANKIEIKKAVESLYGVDVISVKIIKAQPKRRKLGKVKGWRAGYKKAIVKIKEGQKIEVLPR